MADPANTRTSDVQQLLEQTRLSFTSFLRIRSLVSSTSPELISARKDLTDNLTALADDLADLTAAVRAIEKDPYQYGLDVADVARRGRFVQEVCQEVEGMREEMGREGDVREAQQQHPQGGFVGDEDEAERGGDPVAMFEQQQQMEMMREQDVQLEGVYRTVGTLREQADVMGRELAEQNEMVEDLGGDVERVEGKMQRGMKDLNSFIRKNEGEWRGREWGRVLMDGRYGEQLVHWDTDHCALRAAVYCGCDLDRRGGSASCRIDLAFCLSRLLGSRALYGRVTEHQHYHHGERPDIYNRGNCF